MYINSVKKIFITFFTYIFIVNFNEVFLFFKNRREYKKKYNEFISHSSKLGLEYFPVGTYEWGLWRKELQHTFTKRLSINFLHNKLISGTMVFWK